MLNIQIGARGEARFAVTADNAISFLGIDSARVLATPWLIMYLEMTSRDTVKPLLLDGSDTVGTHVNVRHLAATPIGMTARFEAEVIAVDGRRITFRVGAWDDKEQIADGTHERFVVDIERFAEKVQAKSSGRT